MHTELVTPSRAREGSHGTRVQACGSATVHPKIFRRRTLLGTRLDLVDPRASHHVYLECIIFVSNRIETHPPLLEYYQINHETKTCLCFFCIFL